MKRRKSRGSRGSVTVFLTIILVPCLVFASVFGDISRVQLSKAEATSAADLSMNSLMAHFDKNLQEYYGLMASCQSMDDFYKKSQDYFTEMLTQAGVSKEQNDLFIGYLNSLHSSGSPADFLKTSVADNSVKISPATNGALGSNAALIENQVVSFMKYRGPVNAVDKYINRFKGIKKVLDEQSKDEPVVKTKQAYAQAEGDLLENAFYTYLATKTYDDDQQKTKVWNFTTPSYDQYTRLAQDMEMLMKREYEDATNLIVQYYANTDKLQQLQRVKLALKDDKKPEDVGSPSAKKGGGYEIDVSAVQGYIDDIRQSIDSIQGQARDIVNAANSAGLSVNEWGSKTGHNMVQNCEKMQETISKKLENLRGTAAHLDDCFSNLSAAQKCHIVSSSNDSKEVSKARNDARSALGAIRDLSTYMLSDKPTGNVPPKHEWITHHEMVSNYVQLAKAYAPVAKEWVPKVKSRSITFNSKYMGNKEVTLSQFMKKVSSDFKGLHDDYIRCSDELNTVINGGSVTFNGESHSVLSLDKLQEYAVKFVDTRNAWGKAAAGAGTDYGKQEHDEYDGKGADPQTRQSEELAKQITKESVTQLKSRLVNIKQGIDDRIKDLEAFKYGGQIFYTVDTDQKAIDCAKAVIDNTRITLLLHDNSDYAKKCASKLIQPQGQTLCPAPKTRPGDHDPTLSVSTPKLYELLNKQFKHAKQIQSELDDNKKRNSDYKKKADEAKKSSTAADDDTKSEMGGNIKDRSGGKECGLWDGITGFANIIGDILGGKLTTLRNQWLVCEYIMDMCSYSSFANEGRYKLYMEKNPSAHLTLGNYKAAYQSVKDQWADDKARPVEVTENKSLTNHMINKANNQAYLAEAEYILYGKEKSIDNLNAAYTNIFAIREALNLVSGFKNFYPDDKNITATAINGIARLIALATQGIVPVPLTKCVLILTLSTMESAHDLQRLKAGLPVVLFKMTDKKWFCSIGQKNQGGKDAALSNSPNEPSDDGPKDISLYYSDYITLFLMSGLTGGHYSDMLLRLGDVIQANMQLVTSDSSYSLKKSIVYFELKADNLRVKPLMLDLPIMGRYSDQGVDKMRKDTGWCTYSIDMIRGYT